MLHHSFFCSVLPSEVLSGSSQLLLQCAALGSPHSFFRSVLPSEVLSGLLQLLLQCAALWLCLVAQWSDEKNFIKIITIGKRDITAAIGERV